MVLFLSESDVSAAFSMTDCIRVVDAAFRAYASGESILLPRMRYNLPGNSGALRAMAAVLPKSSYFGLKTLTGVPGHRLQEETYFAILLFEMFTGALRAVVSANHLTGLRTGAASGVAATYLAREDARTMGVFGAGAQAKYQVEALCAVRAVSSARIFTPHFDKASAFATLLRKDLGLDAEAVKSPHDAVTRCDLVVTATTATQPVFDGLWVEEGTHISGVGANSPAKRELDAVCFQRSRVVVDFREQAIEEAGDMKSALDAHRIGLDHVTAELGEVVIGAKPGRTSPEEITLFKSVGIAIEDIASAVFVYENALALGLGTSLETHGEIEKALRD